VKGKSVLWTQPSHSTTTHSQHTSPCCGHSHHTAPLSEGPTGSKHSSAAGLLKRIRLYIQISPCQSALRKVYQCFDSCKAATLETQPRACQASTIVSLVGLGLTGHMPHMWWVGGLTIKPQLRSRPAALRSDLNNIRQHMNQQQQPGH
jgi:hypothetical protein